MDITVNLMFIRQCSAAFGAFCAANHKEDLGDFIGKSRPTQSVTVNTDGRNTTEAFDVLISGYNLTSFCMLYVQEEISLRN